MDETQEPVGQSGEREGAESDASRRDFINKLVTAAGTFAVAELLSGSTASAATAKKVGVTRDVPALTAHKADAVGAQALKITSYKLGKFIKFDKVAPTDASPVELPGGATRAPGVGFVISLNGRALGEALVKAGVIPEDADLENAKLTIEFSA